MKTFLMFLFLVLFLAISGCESHNKMSGPVTFVGSGLINDPQQVTLLEKSMTDADIVALLEAGVKAKLPTRLAVAGLESYRYSVKTIDADELAQWEKTLTGNTLIVGIQPVSSLVIGGERANLHALRVAAARMGCELLLVYLQSDNYIDNYNSAAALYWTFVGLWLVPGNVYEHRTVVQAVLVDSRTGAILGTATGDCHLKRPCPAAYGDAMRDKLAKEAQPKAMADLQNGCGQLFRNIEAAARQQAQKSSG